MRRLFSALTALLGAALALSPFVLFPVCTAAALLCWLVPNGVVPISGDGWRAGLCGDASHACNAVTMPAVGKLVAGTVIVGVLGLIAGFLRRDGR